MEITLKESRHILGRVSVVLHDGRPFIDDYIYTNEPIADYLTRFSGILEYDLDPRSSNKHLIHMKVRDANILFVI